MELNDNQTMDKLYLNDSSKIYLFETAKWGNFLAIVGFILCGLILLVGIFFGSLISYFIPATSDQVYNAQFLSKLGPVMAVFYGLIALLYFFPCLFLYKFSAKMKVGLLTASQDSLTESFLNLKSLYKFWGIFTIIILAFYVLAFVLFTIGFSMV